MNDNLHIYRMPNVGCLVGTVYQMLVGQLAAALDSAGLDITPAEYLVLRTLYSTDGLQQCEIASLIGKDKGAISRCVAAMVKKELVYTQPVSYKCLRVFVAPKGRDMQPAVMDVARVCHDSLASMLTPEEMASFGTILNKIINNLNYKK